MRTLHFITVVSLGISFSLLSHAAEISRGCGRLTQSVTQKRTYANGKVIVALAQTEEPAAADTHLLFIFPGSKQARPVCFTLNDVDGQGFSDADLLKITSSYDAQRGLHLQIPYQSGGDNPSAGIAYVRISLRDSKVAFENTQDYSLALRCDNLQGSQPNELIEFNLRLEPASSDAPAIEVDNFSASYQDDGFDKEYSRMGAAGNLSAGEYARYLQSGILNSAPQFYGNPDFGGLKLALSGQADGPLTGEACLFGFKDASEKCFQITCSK